MLREALQAMGRADLIGNGKKHLVPRWQPQGTGGQPEGARRGRPGKPLRTQHARAEVQDHKAGKRKSRRPSSRPKNR